jgi:hypothetical protein
MVSHEDLVQIINVLEKYEIDASALLYNCYVSVIKNKIRTMARMFVIIDSNTTDESSNYNTKFEFKRWSLPRFITPTFYDECLQKVQQLLPGRLIDDTTVDADLVLRYDIQLTNELLGSQQKVAVVPKQQEPEEEQSEAEQDSDEESDEETTKKKKKKKNKSSMLKDTWKQRQHAQVTTRVRNAGNIQLFQLLGSLNISDGNKKTIEDIWTDFQSKIRTRYSIIYFVYLIHLVTGKNLSNVLANYIGQKDILRLTTTGEIPAVSPDVINRYDSFFAADTDDKYHEYDSRHKYNKYLKVEFEPKFIDDYINCKFKTKSKIVNYVSTNIKNMFNVPPDKLEYLNPFELMDKRNIGLIEMPDGTFKYDTEPVRVQLEQLINSYKLNNTDKVYDILYNIFKTTVKKKDIVANIKKMYYYK